MPEVSVAGVAAPAPGALPDRVGARTLKLSTPAAVTRSFRIRTLAVWSPDWKAVNRRPTPASRMNVPAAWRVSASITFEQRPETELEPGFVGLGEPFGRPYGQAAGVDVDRDAGDFDPSDHRVTPTFLGERFPDAFELAGCDGCPGRGRHHFQGQHMVKGVDVISGVHRRRIPPHHCVGQGGVGHRYPRDGFSSAAVQKPG